MNAIQSVLLAWTIGTSSFAATKSPKFCAVDLDNYIEASTDSGFFLDLTKAIANEAQVNIDYVILPWNRAVLSMVSGRCQCFLGADPKLAEFYAGNFGKFFSFVSAKPMWIQNLVVYTRKDKPLISSMEELKGKQIGLLLGVSLRHAQLEKLEPNVHRVYSRTSLFQMLKSGRLDAVVAYRPLAKVFGDHFHYDTRLHISTESPGYFCFDKPQHRRFIQKIDEGFSKLKETGRFQRVFRQNFLKSSLEL